VGIKLRTLTVLRYSVRKSITIVHVSSSYIRINITQLSRCVIPGYCTTEDTGLGFKTESFKTQVKTKT